MICAGFGLRSVCDSADLERAFVAALRAANVEREAVAVIAALSSKLALLELWSEPLGLSVAGLSLAELQRCPVPTLTASAHVTSRFGVGSIAEACALSIALRSGAARLLGPRSNAGSASCALAISEEAR